MKCKDCASCKKGWFKSSPDEYVCIGVKNPFVINDINVECTEYPEKRSPEKRNEVSVMNTAEMWLKAQEDGKVYHCIHGDIAYSKQYGLTDKYDFNYAWGLEAWKDYKQRGLDNLMNCEWEEMDNVMTIEEAEERFGIKILTR